MVSSIHIIGALSLNTKHLKLHLGRECDDWKLKVRNRWQRVSFEMQLCLLNEFSMFATYIK